MSDFQLKTPIVFIIFRRPDTTQKVFEAIRQAKPPKLLVIADAPRSNNLAEAEKCAAAREIINQVDWDCEVLKNYAEVNLGCAKRITTGLNWVFDQVSEAIILEDDCLPHPSFFQYCEELLEYYRYDQRIMSIAGTNFQFGVKVTDYSYYHSCYHDCWGWATWKRAWKYYDFEMKLWSKLGNSNFLAEHLVTNKAAKYWGKYFQLTYEGNKDSWFYRWLFACWVQNGLSIVPNVNLVSNIGFGLDGTHTLEDGSFANLSTSAMRFPLIHPAFIIQNKHADRLNQKNRFDVETDLGIRVKKKANKILNKLIKR
ncbi:hemolytic protein HlpA-like protein [Chondrocystis sp. NIES-4102]|nr:hemolytic protein HlpA-like protein [Chondrocystis sp. NIES-4102]